MKDSRQEIERIKKVSLSKQNDAKHSMFSHGYLFMMQQKQKEIISFLNKFNKSTDILNEKILDIGCGGGLALREFLLYGARSENLYGIDIIEKRIDKAKRRLPGVSLTCASAERLPYENEFFDIVMQSTAFTSILDSEMKQQIAKEMLRVLKKDGIIIWYDFIWNPINPDVKGIGKKEIYKLFPCCNYYFKRITFIPPFARLIVPISWIVAYLLEKIPLLRMFYLAVICKKEENK